MAGSPTTAPHTRPSQRRRGTAHDQRRTATRRLWPGAAGYPGKRLFDLVCAGTLLLLTAPLFAIIAATIRLTSRGPVFYRQRRLGLREQPFTILKFRSMRINADQEGPAYTLQGDARITRVGRWIRKTSLDELPQLINVVRGEMSLLGPRPYVGFELEHWTAEQRAIRASVRPGISGLSQIRGRSNLSREALISQDLKYVERCSLWLDCYLCAGTIVAVVARRDTN